MRLRSLIAALLLAACGPADPSATDAGGADAGYVSETWQATVFGAGGANSPLEVELQRAIDVRTVVILTPATDGGVGRSRVIAGPCTWEVTPPTQSFGAGRTYPGGGCTFPSPVSGVTQLTLVGGSFNREMRDVPFLSAQANFEYRTPDGDRGVFMVFYTFTR